MKGTSFIKISKNIVDNALKSTTDIVYGTVSNDKPLKIKINNKLEIDKDFLILSKLVKKCVVKIPEEKKVGHVHTIKTLTTSSAGEDSHTHIIPEFKTEKALETITLWEDLKKGDKVLMLKVNFGQMYYVIERVE